MRLSALIASALDELSARIRPLLAVVQDGRRGAGAGLLVGDGLVLTNLHVVRSRHPVEVHLEDGRSFPARLLKGEPRLDLALLEIPLPGSPAAVLAEQTPRPGQLVYAFGHPWGQRGVLTGGVLSAVTSVRTPHGEVPILRTDVQLAPGNSGGPLLNAAGEVLGLNAMIFGGDQSVAIPAGVMREFLEAARRERLPEGVI